MLSWFGLSADITFLRNIRMSSISGIDIVTGLLIPVVLYLIKKVIDWTGKVVGNPRPKRKYQFDKIPADKKVEIFFEN